MGLMDNTYFDNARTNVRASYRLWALKHQLKNLLAEYAHLDQAVSDPRFYALKDAVAALQKEMN